MKDKLKFSLLLLMMAIIVGTCYVAGERNQSKFADLVLCNADALAGGEDNDVSISCIEDGSLNCKGVRAKYMIDSTSLRQMK